MDLRQQKTRRSITNAFLTLRRDKPLEKITIRELAQLAQIHKATFYLHYPDIYALSEELERDVVDKVFAGLSDPAAILTDTARFNEELSCLLLSYESILRILFSGSRSDRLVNLLEEKIKSYIFSRHPQLRDSLEMNVVLTYLIQGGYRAYMQYAGAGIREVMLMVNTVASAVLRTYFPAEGVSTEKPANPLPEIG